MKFDVQENWRSKPERFSLEPSSQKVKTPLSFLSLFLIKFADLDSIIKHGMLAPNLMLASPTILHKLPRYSTFAGDSRFRVSRPWIVEFSTSQTSKVLFYFINTDFSKYDHVKLLNIGLQFWSFLFSYFELQELNGWPMSWINIHWNVT